MIDTVFRNRRGRNLEAYLDDVLVKSKTLTEHLGDLRKTLDTLRRYNLKLNPAKCTFGATSGKFLGYLISVRGIEANPGQNISYSEHALSEDGKRDPEAGRADQQLGQIYLEGWRSVFPFLSMFAQ
ncbi:hypothetical protein AXF42_Ash010912 [Apostasia shenzhenica]|uniref:Reverse transcriptase domain-containing protein n=1 Tax=Apostasia shenzhenica TaxID=1088818 RepID=A0A2H9ZQK4_9ASPA|nr:hypothetical protein AXF42_Ash010912 [Apostasia shenzhenica]